jgi:predicted 3-demethylubiquinone-9 3-methyltransferase (glyoxalase superfamily)
MPKINPFLWFDGAAEEAARFYVSVFPRSKIRTITHYGEGGPGPKGSVMTVGFELDGQDFTALNGGPEFKFSHAISFVVHCKTQKKIDAYWTKLTRGGKVIQCGWLTDKFGLSWQIVPTALPDLLDSKHPDRAGRVFAAIMKMRKLDIKKLQMAYKKPSRA